MQIDKARHLKIYVVLRKMKNEDSRGLIRLYKGNNYFHKFQDILHRRKHLKRRRKHAFQHITHSQAPMRIEQGAHTPKGSTKVTGHMK